MNIDAAKQEWESETEPNPLPGRKGVEQPFRRLEKAIAWVEFPRTGLVQFKKIESLPCAARGDATRLLKLLTDICDRYGLTIEGNPEPYPPSASSKDKPILTREELFVWYGKHGFDIGKEGAVWHMRRTPKDAEKDSE